MPRKNRDRTEVGRISHCNIRPSCEKTEVGLGRTEVGRTSHTNIPPNCEKTEVGLCRTSKMAIFKPEMC